MASDIVISFPGGARVDADFGHLVVKTDQDGSAPSPFALFLASLGTCAGIYVLSFCQQRGLPTEDIRIRQSMESDPVTHMISQVKLDITQEIQGFPENGTYCFYGFSLVPPVSRKNHPAIFIRDNNLGRC